MGLFESRFLTEKQHYLNQRSISIEYCFYNINIEYQRAIFYRKCDFMDMLLAFSGQYNLTLYVIFKGGTFRLVSWEMCLEYQYC